MNELGIQGHHVSSPRSNSNANHSLPNHRMTGRRISKNSYISSVMAGNIGLTASLWQRLEADFQLPYPNDNPQIKAQIDWYSRHQDYLYQTIERSAPYISLVYQEVQKRNMPTELVLLPIIESAYYPFAYSGAGAAGLWQLMPGTATNLGLKRNGWYDGRRDIFESTNAALDYLDYLQKYFNGDWLLALAAYDAGIGSVQEAIRRNIRMGRGTDFWSLHLPRETQSYIPHLLALAIIIKNRDHYAIHLPQIDDQPHLAIVDMGLQINLMDAAKLAGISFSEFKQYNPGYKRLSTEPNGETKLLLPIDKINLFKERIATYVPSKRNRNKVNNSTRLVQHSKPNISTYYVRSGDTLTTIAKRLGVKTVSLKRWNHSAETAYLQPGQRIIVYH